jgi:hypothetical protein
VSTMIGRAVVVAGAAAGIVAMLLTWAGSTTYWEAYRYWDVATTVLGAITIVAALAAVTPVIARFAALIAAAAGGVLLANSMQIFDELHRNDVGTKIGLWVGVVAAGGLFVGAILLLTASVSELTFAEPLAAGWPGAAPSTSAQPSARTAAPSGTPIGPEPAGPTDRSPQPPPGWYPDPSREADQRRWDGRQWTAETR